MKLGVTFGRRTVARARRADGQSFSPHAAGAAA